MDVKGDKKKIKAKCTETSVEVNMPEAECR